MPSSEHPEYARFARRNQTLRQEILELDLSQLAIHTGAKILPGQNSLELHYWDSLLEIHYPGLQIIEKISSKLLPDFQQAMVLYYLRLADGTLGIQDWVAFSELPDGKFYQTAFQSYTGHELARQIGNDTPGFNKTAQYLNAQKGKLGDASYIFQAFPKVSLLIVNWQSDEDFPASYQILFNDSASHYLPTDGLAILGSMLTRKLIKSYKSLADFQKSK